VSIINSEHKNKIIWMNQFPFYELNLEFEGGNLEQKYLNVLRGLTPISRFQGKLKYGLTMER